MLVFSARYFGKQTKPWLNHDQHFFYNGIPVISVLGNWIYNCSPLAFPSLSVPPKILEAWMASSLAGTSTKPIAGGGPASQETVRKMKRSQESCDYPPSKTKRITLQVVATPRYKSFQPNDFDYNPPIGRKKVTLHHLAPFFPVSYKVKLFGNKMFDIFDLLSCLAQHTFPNSCPFLKQRQLVEIQRSSCLNASRKTMSSTSLHWKTGIICLLMCWSEVKFRNPPDMGFMEL